VPFWDGFAAEAPELADLVRTRFEATGLGLLATVRRDGSPRISPVEPMIAADDLWLGMMPASLKAADVRRDPRVALHAATIDTEVHDGDAKVAGRAVPVAEAGDEMARYRAAVAARAAHVPDGPFPLFRLDLSEASHLQPDADGQFLVIQIWRPGREVERIERR